MGLVGGAAVASAVADICASVLSLSPGVLLLLVSLALPVGLVKIREDLSKFLVGLWAAFHRRQRIFEASGQGLLQREAESVEVPTRLVGVDLEAGEVMMEVVALLHFDARECTFGLELDVEVTEHISEFLYKVRPLVEGRVVGLVLQKCDIVLLREFREVRGCKKNLWAVSPMRVGFSSEGHETLREEWLPLTTILSGERFWITDVEFTLAG